MLSAFNSKKKMFAAAFVFIIFVGLSYLYVYIDFEPIISQGDHGRDLYCFKMTAHGAVPYRDYWWQYGPLMPYYYSVFFRLWGESIQSVLYGKYFLVFVTGILIFLSARFFMSLPMAVLSSLFFWAFRPDFFYTFNHIGGLFLIVGIVFFFFQYRASKNPLYYWTGLISCGLLALVRLNLGLASTAAFFISVFRLGVVGRGVGRRAQISRLGVHFIAFSLAVGLFYTFCTWGVPLSDLKKCFPYFANYRYDNAPLNEIVHSLWNIIWVNLTHGWARKTFSAILLLSLVRLFFESWRKKSWQTLEAPVVLGIFLLLNAHESFITISIYRLFWIYPLIILIFLALIDRGCQGVRWAQVLVISFFAYLTIPVLWQNHGIARFYKTPERLLDYRGNRVYLANSSWGEHKLGSQSIIDGGAPQWIRTVSQASNYLREHILPGEAFLALPYDSLYYFLSGRDSASYYLAFFQYVFISPEEETAIIQLLEERPVPYVLISNRSQSSVPALGTFGVDYCPKLAEYIFEHYEEVATFGEWDQPPGFTHFHAVKILKKMP